jgi:nicotinamidase-related amidase
VSGRDALIVVDLQVGFGDPSWGRRDNPACEANVVRLAREWQRRGWPIVMTRHDSSEPDSPLAPGRPGNALAPALDGISADLLVVKSVHSCFHGSPDLDGWLRAHGVDAVTVCGITTDHCCNTTARVAADLGYRVRFVLDATHTFDRRLPDGTPIPAEQVARVTAASLHGEFGLVVRTDDCLIRPRQAHTEVCFP